MNIVIAITEPELQTQAEQLAIQLNVPINAIVPLEAAPCELLLVLTLEHLELRDMRDPKLVPLYVDFVAGTQGYRRLQPQGIKQLIAKACGLKPGFRPSIIDATAGLGHDAFVLANLGCEMRLLERSPIIAALLNDGIRRAKVVCDIEMPLILTHKSISC